MSDLKGKALQAASEVVKGSIEGLDPKAIAQETAKILTSKEKLPTYRETLGEDPEAEDDRKVIRTLGEMADLDSMGEEEKAKLVWEEMRAGLGWKKGKFWGFADKMGEWMLEKAIGWGVLPVSLVTAAMAKRKLREEADKLKGKGSANGGASTGTNFVPDADPKLDPESEKEKGVLDKTFGKLVPLAEEKTGIELDPQLARFTLLKEKVAKTVEEYEALGKMLGLTDLAASIKPQIKQLIDAIKGIDYAALSDKAKKEVAALLSQAGNDPEKVDLAALRDVLLDEIKNLPDLEIIHELRAAKFTDPVDRARAIGKRGTTRLLSLLEKKLEANVEKDAKLAPIRKLCTDIENLPSYTDSRSDSLYDQLEKAVEGLGTGIALDNTMGIADSRGTWHVVDYSSGNWTNFPLGFGSKVPGKEIAELPKVYFGSFGVMKAQETFNEIGRAFFDPLKETFGDQSKRSAAAWEELKKKLDQGEITYGKMALEPASTLGPLIEAMKTDMQEGNLVLGTAYGLSMAIISSKIVIVKTHLATTFATVFRGLQHSLDGGLWAGAKAAGSEYVPGATPFILFYGSAVVLRKMAHLGLGGIVPGLAHAALSPVITTYRIGVNVFRAGHATVRAALLAREVWNAPQTIGKFVDIRWRYFTNQDYLRRFAPQSVRTGLLSGEINRGLLGEIRLKATQVAYWRKMEEQINGPTRPAAWLRSHVVSYHHQIESAQNALDELVHDYVTRNFVSSKTGFARYLTGRVATDTDRQIRQALLQEYGDALLDAGQEGDAIFGGARRRLPSDPLQLQRTLDEIVLKAGNKDLKLHRLRHDLADAKRIGEIRDELANLNRDPQANRKRIQELKLEDATLSAKAIQDQPLLEAVATARETVEQLLRDPKIASDAAKQVALVAKIRQLNADEKKIFDGLVKKIEGLGHSLDAAAFKGNLEVMTSAEREMQEWFEQRVRLIKALDKMGKTDLARELAQQTDELTAAFRSAKMSLLRKLCHDYDTVIKHASADDKTLIKGLFKRLVVGQGGGNALTRVMRSQGGALFLGARVALPMLLKYVQDKDDPKVSAFQLFEEVGLEGLDALLSAIPGVGVAYEGYRVYEGKDIHGNDLTGWGYAQHTLWGLVNAGGVVASIFSMGGGSAVTTGVRAGAGVGFKGGKIVYRAWEIVQKVGGIKKFIALSQEWKNAKSVGSKAMMAGTLARTVEHSANVASFALLGTELAYAWNVSEPLPMSAQLQKDLELDTPGAIIDASAEQKSFNPQSA